MLVNRSSWCHKKDHKNGFTLIELLVVISIIGLLASVILSALGQAKTKSQRARAQVEMKQIVNAITVVTDENDKYMYQISPTTSYTAACTNACNNLPCLSPNNLIGNNGICYIKWVAVLDALEAHSKGLYSNLNIFNRDIWGSPYLIDENEGVHGQQCGQDYIGSAGPDGQRTGGGDDITYRIPFKSLGKIFDVADVNSPPNNPQFNNGNKCKCVAVDTCEPLAPYF